MNDKINEYYELSNNTHMLKHEICDYYITLTQKLNIPDLEISTIVKYILESHESMNITLKIINYVVQINKLMNEASKAFEYVKDRHEFRHGDYHSIFSLRIDRLFLTHKIEKKELNDFYEKKNFVYTKDNMHIKYDKNHLDVNNCIITLGVIAKELVKAKYKLFKKK